MGETMLRLKAAFVIAVVAGLWSTAFGQPSHTRELFRYDLTSATTSVGQVSNTSGSFSASGWKPSSANGQLKVYLSDYMPYEGTVEVQVKGLSASVVTKDWIPFSIWSRGRGKFYQSDGASYPSEGTYAFLKTDESKVSGSNLAWKLFFKSQYDPIKANHQTADIVGYAFSASTTYTLRYVWKPGTIWFQIWSGGSKVAEASSPWVLQSEAFLFVFLGKSNEYSSMTGITFSNLVLKGPEKSIAFLDVSKSAAAITDTTVDAQGMTWADVNNDGEEDIYISYYNRPNQLYVAVADSDKFKESASTYGLNDAGGAFASATADFNGDGKLDVFLANYGSPNRLLLSQGGTAFNDQTAAWNIATTNSSATNPLAFDLENDGDIDLFVANSGMAHELYINQNNTSFTRVELSGLPIGTGARAAAGDVNKDGYVDIFYPRRNAAAVLLINNKNGGFEDRASSYGLAITTDPNAPTLADLDNDGNLDLLLSVASAGDAKPQVLYYRNTGGGTFTKSGTIFIDAYGAVVGDVDNDGLQDIYLIKRNKFSAEVSDYGARFYRNISTPGSISFSEYTGTGLEAIFQDGRGGAMADFNGDGKLDIYGVAKGSTGSNTLKYGRNFLFKNTTSNDNGFLLVKVLDKKKVSGYLGAKVELFDQSGVNGARIGYREISSIQGYQSQPSRMVHFGMGANTAGVLRVTLPDGQVLTQSVNRNSLVVVDPTGGNAQAFELVKGNNQTGVAGTVLNDSVTVRVYAAGEPLRPLAGQIVTFAVTQGNGALNGSSTSLTVQTDLNGLARVAFKLGQTAGSNNNRLQISALNKSGQQIINLSATGTPAAPIDIVASANAGPAARMDKVSGDAQLGYMGDALANPIVVRVTDQFSNPISGYSVTFSVASGGGGFGAAGSSPATVVSGTDGTAQITWRMGSTLGSQLLHAAGAFNAAAPAVFSATASEPLRRLAYESGDRQSAKVNQMTDVPLMVRLRDFQGNAISGAAVHFSVVAGGGKINGLSTLDVNTTPEGLASIRPTMGSVIGDTNNVFQATSQGAAGTVLFKISATAGAPTKLIESSGNNKSGKAGRTLSAPFVVRVTDAANNPVSGYPVDFSVLAGGGSFNSQPSLRVNTDKSGFASAYYRLGTATGTNTVNATASGLTGSPITFIAVAEAGSPAMLFKISGDNQKGTLGEPLLQPLVVALSDSFSNPIPNHPIQFRVSRGNGNIGGQALATVQTNALGRASVIFSLGTSDYINEVSVSGQYLGLEIPTIPTPLVFSAMTSAGDADSLVYVSGNYQVGAINQTLPEPFKVMVTDAHGVPVSNHPVVFQAISPGTHFSGATQVTKKTDDSGVTSIMASIGSNFGNAIYSFEVRSELNGIPLGNSPVQFSASGRLTTATKLVYLYGNGLAGTVGQFLTDSLKVRAVDALDKPVANQPVSFEVYEGSALLNGQGNSFVASSGANGIARVALKLGSLPGKIKIRAVAQDGLAPLANSPVEFEVTAQIGLPDGLRSILTVTSPVTADGNETAKIIVTLHDNQGNAVPGKLISIYTSGLDVRVNQPGVATDNNGQTQGSISSIRAGLAKVWTMVDNRHVPQDTARVVFSAGTPARAVPFGSGQIALRGSVLPMPLGLYLYDANNNPVPNVPVTFRIKSGGGAIVQPQPVATDTQGKAQIFWNLGSKIGEQYVAAVVPQLGSYEPEFWAIANPPEPKTMTIVRGDRQIGAINQAMPDSFVVAMRDSSGAPAEGLSVIFSQTKGQGQFISPNPVTSDKRGYAAVLFKPGAVAGEYAVTAYHTSGLVAEFPFIVQAQATVFLNKVKDAKSSGRPNEEMAIQAKVTDAYNRLLAGETVKWEVLDGGGTLQSAATAQSNAQGEVSISWKLGLKGSQSVKLAPVGKAGGALLFSSLVVNAKPALTVPADVKVLAGNLLTFGISAYDADGDAITFGARNLPAGAKFDSTANRLFSWTPTRNQAQGSPYTVIFIARDAFQSADTARVKITVETLNTAPSIDSFEPGDTLITRLYDQPMLYQVFASDLDNDQLTYEWWVNDIWSGSESSVLFQPDAAYFPADNVVLVRVSDGKATRELRWHLTLKTSVRLSAFTATAQKAAVLLTWQTAAEAENLGFKVLRSDRSDGLYEPLTSEMIPSATGGSYSYLDRTAQAGMKYYYKIQDVDRSGKIATAWPGFGRGGAAAAPRSGAELSQSIQSVDDDQL